MSKKNIGVAKAYYLAVNNKNISEVEKYVHPSVELISPLTHITGKESVVNAVKGYMTVLKSLAVRTACGTDDQVLLVYDYDVVFAPSSTLHAAVLMDFKDDLIARIELFFDARPFSS